MSSVTLTHSLVNGGTAVSLNCNGLTFGWKNLTNKDPAEGEYDLIPVSNGGFENPVINIQGVIDVNNISSNELTQEHLVNFATIKSTTPVSLSISSGSVSYYIGGRPSAGYSTSGANTLGSYLSVWIDDFSIVPDFSSEQGHIWNYTINCTETI